MAVTVSPNKAAVLHPHTFPPSFYDAVPLIVTAGCVTVGQRFRFYRCLDEAQLGHTDAKMTLGL